MAIFSFFFILDQRAIEPFCPCSLFLFPLYMRCRISVRRRACLSVNLYICPSHANPVKWYFQPFFAQISIRNMKLCQFQPFFAISYSFLAKKKWGYGQNFSEDFVKPIQSCISNVKQISKRLFTNFQLFKKNAFFTKKKIRKLITRPKMG